MSAISPAVIPPTAIWIALRLACFNGGNGLENETYPRLFPRGCRRFSCDLQLKQGGECLFANYILRRTDAELVILEGE
jgi:hypothetical protein